MKNIKTRNSEKEETYKVKKKTLDLLPDADNNIAKLQVRVTTYVQFVLRYAVRLEMIKCVCNVNLFTTLSNLVSLFQILVLVHGRFQCPEARQLSQSMGKTSRAIDTTIQRTKGSQ